MRKNGVKQSFFCSYRPVLADTCERALLRGVAAYKLMIDREI
ncbi:MAG TPA: hypothetical protein VIL66_06850 [Bacillota bacterium]